MNKIGFITWETEQVPPARRDNVVLFPGAQLGNPSPAARHLFEPPTDTEVRRSLFKYCVGWALVFFFLFMWLLTPARAGGLVRPVDCIDWRASEEWCAQYFFHSQEPPAAKHQEPEYRGARASDLWPELSTDGMVVYDNPPSETKTKPVLQPKDIGQ